MAQKPQDRHKHPISGFRIPTSTREKLDKYAESIGISATQALTQIIEEYITSKENSDDTEHNI